MEIWDFDSLNDLWLKAISRIMQVFICTNLLCHKLMLVGVVDVDITTKWLVVQLLLKLLFAIYKACFHKI
jgi:hypothetical protein